MDARKAECLSRASVGRFNDKNSVTVAFLHDKIGRRYCLVPITEKEKNLVKEALPFPRTVRNTAAYRRSDESTVRE